ncbi:hypothetical protein BP6252_07410 [Coleophoma cylindrospora]|uniref:Uncharacterized protein n=1 Tax=Coleophoma cylindrospora TaxID=1849047 RepID=A0A3D8RHI1_9HELO|nr:hypothetical protein BP6252_07410 [Coleophoma cylindrospora]
MQFSSLLAAALIGQLVSSVMASGCTQMWCQVSVCATDVNDAFNVASWGLTAVMGPDCADWNPDPPTDNGQGPCAAGLINYSGQFAIWRSWSANDQYSGTFAQWGNFLGATCGGGKVVSCNPKSGGYPDPSNGKCQIQRW